MFFAGSGHQPSIRESAEELDSESEVGSQRPKKQQLDMLNLHVAELREPKYSVLKKGDKPVNSFRRSYLPNGQSVELKSFEDVRSGVEKLFIEDWKRPEVYYQTVFQGETHQLV